MNEFNRNSKKCWRCDKTRGLARRHLNVVWHASGSGLEISCLVPDNLNFNKINVEICYEDRFRFFI